MVAIMRQREPRHYPMGPIHQDRPLKVFDETKLDYEENIERLRAAKSWWPEIGAAIAAMGWALWMKWGR